MQFRQQISNFGGSGQSSFSGAFREILNFSQSKPTGQIVDHLKSARIKKFLDLRYLQSGPRRSQKRSAGTSSSEYSMNKQAS